jgi:nucleoside-diphosphate-sugar epimerase
MKVLVTGATGFIGRRLLSAAPARWEIVAIARDAPPHASGGRASVEWVPADLSAPGFERRLPPRFDAVLHLAQARGQSDTAAGARETVDVNVVATARLLEHARASAAGRFVLASTATVYRRSDQPLSEDAPIDCPSLYAASKRSAELLVRPYATWLSCHALRLFTVYGEGQRERLVARLAERVRTGEPITVEGRHGLLLSPVHVDDVVAALVAAVEDRATTEGLEVTNVGGPDALGVREIAETLGRVVGREPRLNFTDDSEPGGYVADISKLSRTFDIAPPRGFEQGATTSFAGRPAVTRAAP